MKKISPKKELYRTLIRVKSIDKEQNIVNVVLPGWSTREEVQIPLDSIPASIRSLLKPVFRFHAQVNIGADTKDQLEFSSWEGE